MKTSLLVIILSFFSFLPGCGSTQLSLDPEMTEAQLDALPSPLFDEVLVLFTEPTFKGSATLYGKIEVSDETMPIAAWLSPGSFGGAIQETRKFARGKGLNLVVINEFKTAVVCKQTGGCIGSDFFLTGKGYHYNNIRRVLERFRTFSEELKERGLEIKETKLKEAIEETPNQIKETTYGSEEEKNKTEEGIKKNKNDK